MRQVVCPHCREWVCVKPFLIYFSYVGYFIANCPECGNIAYERRKDDESTISS